MKFVWFLVFLFHFYPIWAQLPGQERMANWKDAGYRGIGRTQYEIRDFVQAGGVPDGITPNDIVLKNLLQSIQHDSCLIYFPKGVFYFEKPVNLNKTVVLRGASPDSTTLLFRLNTLNDLIFARGSRTLPDTQVLQDIPSGSRWFIPVSVAGFASGDDVDIQEDDSTLVVSDWAFRTTGQINRIERIQGDTLFLVYPMRRTLLSGRNIRVNKIRPRKEIGLENFRIIRLDSTALQSSNIEFNYCINCWVKCVVSENCNFAHIALNRCSNVEISGSYFHHSFGYGEGGRGYGLVLQAGSGQCLATNNIFRHLRHSMLLQSGANGNVLGYNYSADPFWIQPGWPSDFAGDMVLHGNYPYANLFEGNTVQNVVIDNSHGINGPYNTFFRNRTELYGFIMSSQEPSNSQNFIGNEITNDSLNMGNFLLEGTDHFLYGNNLKGTISPSGTNALPVASLYLNAAPSYYTQFSHWPPIGVPNLLLAHKTEAAVRDQLQQWTNCAAGIPVGSLSTIGPLDELNVYPNPAERMLKVSGYTEGREGLLIGMDGRVFPLESNSASGFDPEFSLTGIPAGLYIFQFRIRGEVRRFKVSVVR